MTNFMHYIHIRNKTYPNHRRCIVGTPHRKASALTYSGTGLLAFFDHVHSLIRISTFNSNRKEKLLLRNILQIKIKLLRKHKFWRVFFFLIFILRLFS